MGAACTKCEFGQKQEIGPKKFSPADNFAFFRDAIRLNFHGRGMGENVFKELGGKDDSIIMKDEFVAGLSKLGFKGNADQLFDLIDFDNEGRISKEEFIASTKEGFVEKGALRDFQDFILKQYSSVDEAFKAFESNQKLSGHLDKKSLQQMLEVLKFDGDVDTIWRILDSSQDGKVSFKEFKRRMGVGDKT